MDLGHWSLVLLVGPSIACAGGESAAMSRLWGILEDGAARHRRRTPREPNWTMCVLTIRTRIAPAHRYLRLGLGCFRRVVTGYVQLGVDKRSETCNTCLLYTSPSPRDRTRNRMPSSA